MKYNNILSVDSKSIGDFKNKHLFITLYKKDKKAVVSNSRYNQNNFLKLKILKIKLPILAPN